MCICLSVSFSLSLSLSLCVSLCFYFSLSLCFFVCLSLCLSLFLYLCLSLSVCLSVSLSLSLFRYIYIYRERERDRDRDRDTERQRDRQIHVISFYNLFLFTDPPFSNPTTRYIYKNTIYFYSQIPRLLGVNSEKIVLLDNKTKLLAKSQNLSSLEDWLSGSGRSHDGLLLEFRGTKPWLLTTPSPENLKSVTAAIWQALDVDGRFLNSGALRRDSLQFGGCSLCNLLHAL